MPDGATSRLNKQDRIPEISPQSFNQFKLRLSAAGAHLFDRVSGINVLIDEVSFPKSTWSAAPRYVSVALTNACDLDCRYCYAPKTPSRLETTRLLSWLTQLDANGCLGIGFGGGEPTLYPGFAQVCRRVASSTNLAVSFTTHGHHINAALASELRGSIHFVRVSMDGIGATYEEMRGRSFSKLMEAFCHVRTLSRFGINFVVNARTLRDLNSAIAIACDVGASEFLLLPEQATAKSSGIDPETSERLIEWVCRYQGQLPLSISEAGAEGLATCDPCRAETGLRAYGHIASNGVLKRSSFENEGVAIGVDGVMTAISELENSLQRTT